MKTAGVKFVDWVVGAAGKKAIADYKIGGEQLFFPTRPVKVSAYVPPVWAYTHRPGAMMPESRLHDSRGVREQARTFTVSPRRRPAAPDGHRFLHVRHPRRQHVEHAGLHGLHKRFTFWVWIDRCLALAYSAYSATAAAADETP